MLDGLRRGLATVIVAMALLGGPLWAQSQELTRAQALHLGRSLVAEGQPAMAQVIAEAILKADPRDSEAQVLMAAVLQAMGAPDQAGAHARAAHRHGETAQTRFEGAMLAGRAAFDREAYGQAQFWLRRAAQTAPDEAARAQAARNFAAVRRVNPLDVQFNLGVRQATNINNGTSTEVIEFLGLPFVVSGASRALSGQELRADLALRYRLAQTPVSRTSLSFSLGSRSYRLSSAARRQAPEARASDFAHQRVEMGVIHQMARPGATGPVSFGAAIGRSWYGGQPLSDHLRLSAARSMVLTPERQLTILGDVQRSLNHTSRARHATRIGLGMALHHGAADENHLSVTLRAEQTSGQSIHVRNTTLRAGLAYDLAHPVAGLRLGADLDLEQRRFPAGGLQPEGRQDRTATFGLRVAFDDLDYMGFMPMLDIGLSRTQSNLPIHARRSADISLGIKSRF